jgi:hypothetical protein
MANVAKEKTAKQKASEAAYKGLMAAQEKAEKNDTADNKKAVAAAGIAYIHARDAERRERFTTVGRDRAELVSVKLAALAKCANKKVYDFTAADVDKIEAVLKEDFETTIAAFRSALTGKAPAAKGGRLQFD